MREAVTPGDERVLLDGAIRAVIERDACSGCGACTLLDGGLRMRESADGYARPHRDAEGKIVDDATVRFASACPGVTVSANPTAGARRHPTMGAYLEVWMAWATDPAVRHQASSGGVLTALNTWLLESGRVSRVVGAASAADPRRSVPVTITTRAEAFDTAGSRYSPVSILSNVDVTASDSAVVAKPCEASALARLTRHDGTGAAEAPVILSFFCAGTPSSMATDRLLDHLGMSSDVKIDELWYRGRGWPGRFTARAGETVVDTSYDDSWGKALGPSTQWRCKICPDGVGESADIVAADYWETDDRGYPRFIEGDGASALIARTPRGLQLVLEAVDEGVIQVETITMNSVAEVQPLQRERRQYLAARLLGSVLAGRKVPSYRGFELLRLSLHDPRKAITVLRGAYGRVRRAEQAKT